MSRFFKSIVRELATDAGIEVVRGYVIARMRGVTPQDFAKAIKDGTHTLGVTDNKDKTFARRWTPVMEKLSINGQQLKRDKLTSANVMLWLKVDRPDLAKVITDMKEQGADWLEKDVQQMFNFLFPQAQTVTNLRLVKKCDSSTFKNDQSTKDDTQQPQIK